MIVEGRKLQDPADVTQSFSGVAQLPVGGRDMLHTVVIDGDRKIVRVVVNPLRVERGGWGGAGTPVLARSRQGIHHQVLEHLREACRVFGTNVNEVNGVGVIAPD